MLFLATRHSLVPLASGLLLTGAALGGCRDGLGLAPPCDNPAPLYEYDSPARGYFVGLSADVDPFRTTATLERKYNFRATSVIHIGFTADFSDRLREQLRCEGSVRYLERNQNPPPPPAGQ
jgi:hypothetical protein